MKKKAEKKESRRPLKKELLLAAFALTVGCSSVGNPAVPVEKAVSRDIVVNNGIAEVARKYGDIVEFENVGIYKNGFRDWKVILYSDSNYYVVIVREDGKIISSQKKRYSKDGKTDEIKR